MKAKENRMTVLKEQQEIKQDCNVVFKRRMWYDDDDCLLVEAFSFPGKLMICDMPTNYSKLYIRSVT